MFYYAQHGIWRVFCWYKADVKASGLIGSKEGYVLNIIGIFKQYWGYFERLSWWQQWQIPSLLPTSLQPLAQPRCKVYIHGLQINIYIYIQLYIYTYSECVYVQYTVSSVFLFPQIIRSHGIEYIFYLCVIFYVVRLFLLAEMILVEIKCIKSFVSLFRAACAADYGGISVS